MYNDVLESLGLTPNEARIYQVLLELKQSSLSTIATRSETHRRNTYDAIQRLVYKGLAYQVVPKKTLTYAPVHPRKLKEIIQEHDQSLDEILPGLVKKFDHQTTPQSISVYKGPGGYKNYLSLQREIGAGIHRLGTTEITSPDSKKKPLPAEFSGESSVDIFGDYVGICTGLSDKITPKAATFYILKDPILAKDYVKWWKLLWKLLPD